MAQNIFADYFSERELHREIERNLCRNAKINCRSSFSSLEDILEYVFGTTTIDFPDFSRGPFGLQYYKAYAEDSNFFDIAKKNKDILPLMKEIKQIYLRDIITQEGMSYQEFINKHMKELARILNTELSPEEFYKRAEMMRDNLEKNKVSYLPNEVLYPDFYRKQEKKKILFKYRTSL
jgi:hypothetical protein